MENIKELYVISQPIETPLGKLKFLKVKDYPRFMEYISYLKLTKSEILGKIIRISKESAKFLENKSFVEIIHLLKPHTELFDVFKELFTWVFDNENAFESIVTDEEFDYYRELILNSNGINFDRPNPNAEIEHFNNLKRQYDKAKQGGEITLEAIITSVWLYIGTNPEELTIYQLYALFNRIAKFQNHSEGVIYNSVTGEVKVEGWYEHVELFKDEHKGKETLEEFSKSVSGMMGA